MLIYPPTVFTFNNPSYPEGVEVKYDLYEEAMATKKVGDLITHQASAPGCGYTTYRITRMGPNGVFGVIVENTMRVMDPEECV